MDKEIKILLVDDEADFVQPMAYWFKSKGYSVIVAYNYEEALKAIKEEILDIVFLDLIMPDTDGFTVAKKIREFNTELPLVIMSSYVEDTRIEKKVSFYGIQGIFYKGEDFTKALSLLESVLNKNN